MQDAAGMFSIDQDIGQTANTYLSLKSVAMGTGGTIPGLGGTVPVDIGSGTPVFIDIVITEAVTSGGAATIDFQLVGADNEALDSNKVVYATTGALVYSTLTVGARPKLGTLPTGITKAFIGLQYVIADATTTAGKVTAGLSLINRSSLA